MRVLVTVRVLNGVGGPARAAGLRLDHASRHHGRSFALALAGGVG